MIEEKGQDVIDVFKNHPGCVRITAQQCKSWEVVVVIQAGDAAASFVGGGGRRQTGWR